MHFPNIKALRVRRGLSQEDCAKLLHMQRTVYRRYETGEREIPVWAVIQLARHYGVTTDYLLGPEGETQP